LTHPEELVRPFETPLTLHLRVAGVPIRILTNAEDLWASLRHYYRAYVSPADSLPVAVVKLVQGEGRPPGEPEFLPCEFIPGPSVCDLSPASTGTSRGMPATSS